MNELKLKKKYMNFKKDNKENIIKITRNIYNRYDEKFTITLLKKALLTKHLSIIQKNK